MDGDAPKNTQMPLTSQQVDAVCAMAAAAHDAALASTSAPPPLDSAALLQFPVATVMTMPPPEQRQQQQPTTGTAPVAGTANGISEDEIALYDRQIRLWGVKAQEKIRRAHVLVITIGALANEIAKNLVLAGIGSLTLLDGAIVTEADLGAQFLLAAADPSSPPASANVGRNRAEAASHNLQRLNPRVRIFVDPEGVSTKSAGYFQGFDVVIATDLDPASFQVINTATRLHGKAFYAAGSHGLYGYIFSDLIEHDFVFQRDASKPTRLGPESRTCTVVKSQVAKDEAGHAVETVTKRELYSTWLLASDAATLPKEFAKHNRLRRGVTPLLSCFRALWDFSLQSAGRVPGGKTADGRAADERDDLERFTTLALAKHKALNLPNETLTPQVLRQFLQNLGSEIAPVTAVLGGLLAQDVINVLGQTQPPIQNMVFFDGDGMVAYLYPLHPEGPLGRALLSGLDAALPVPDAAPMVGLSV